MHSIKKRNLKKILPILCSISVMSSGNLVSAKLSSTCKFLAVGGVAIGSIYALNKLDSDSKNNRKKIKQDISSEIPEYLYGLNNSIDEELKKLSGNNKQNHYSLGSTAKRRFVASVENKSSIQRALESSKLYKESKREVTCWDASLAFAYNIYEKYGPNSNNPINNINIGLASYNIPIAFGLANHVFCYVLVDNTLFFVDPLLGVKISIDLTNNYEIIKEQVTSFYITQKDSNVLPSLGKLYGFLNKAASTISQFTKFKNKNSPYGKEGVFISDNILVENKRLSQIKWMSDIPFFRYLLRYKSMPGSASFNKYAPCELFG